jgi:hypothetical protein
LIDGTTVGLEEAVADLELETVAIDKLLKLLLGAVEDVGNIDVRKLDGAELRLELDRTLLGKLDLANREVAAGEGEDGGLRDGLDAVPLACELDENGELDKELESRVVV